MVNQTMGEKEYLDDAISSQKLITSSYNTYANECCNNQLRADFMNILKEEHDIQYEVFQEMSTRGFYQTTPAEEQKVQQAKQKYSSMNQG